MVTDDKVLGGLRLMWLHASPATARAFLSSLPKNHTLPDKDYLEGLAMLGHLPDKPGHVLKSALVRPHMRGKSRVRGHTRPHFDPDGLDSKHLYDLATEAFAKGHVTKYQQIKAALVRRNAERIFMRSLVGVGGKLAPTGESNLVKPGPAGKRPKKQPKTGHYLGGDANPIKIQKAIGTKTTEAKEGEASAKRQAARAPPTAARVQIRPNGKKGYVYNDAHSPANQAKEKAKAQAKKPGAQAGGAGEVPPAPFSEGQKIKPVDPNRMAQLLRVPMADLKQLATTYDGPKFVAYFKVHAAKLIAKYKIPDTYLEELHESLTR